MRNISFLLLLAFISVEAINIGIFVKSGTHFDSLRDEPNVDRSWKRFRKIQNTGFGRAERQAPIYQGASELSLKSANPDLNEIDGPNKRTIFKLSQPIEVVSERHIEANSNSNEQLEESDSGDVTDQSKGSSELLQTQFPDQDDPTIGTSDEALSNSSDDLTNQQPSDDDSKPIGDLDVETQETDHTIEPYQTDDKGATDQPDVSQNDSSDSPNNDGSINDNQTTNHPGSPDDEQNKKDDEETVSSNKNQTFPNGLDPTGQDPTGQFPSGQEPTGPASNALFTTGEPINVLFTSSQIPTEHPSNGLFPSGQIPTGQNPVSPGYLDECLQLCPTRTEYAPLCGTNGVTYDNPSALQCAVSCGVDVQESSKGRCQLPVQTSTQTPTEPSGFEGCMRNCHSSNTLSPVCGSDGVTYDNRGRATCAALCGKDVSVLSVGPCATTTVSTTTVPTTSDIDLRPATEPDAECLLHCPTTSEYKPVCGTDGLTYVNAGKLICAAMCGSDVGMLNPGACSDVTPPPSPTTTQSDKIDDTLPPEVRNCLDRCALTKDYWPVCGTNGVTYPNSNMMNCASQCGVDVGLSHNGPCSGRTTTTTPATLTSPAGPGFTTPNFFDDCLEYCPSSSEYIPVCGTNGLTYYNREQLVCDYICDADVTIKHAGPCFDESTTTMPIPTFTEMPKEDIDCMERCPKTLEYSPVCGTNGVTYFNPSLLYCVRSCGISDIWPKHEGSCREEDAKVPTELSEEDVCVSRCPKTDDCMPVCGTNYVTYRNPRELICAQKCGVDVKLLRIGTCPEPSPTSSAPTPTSKPPPASSSRKDREPAPTTPDPTGKPGDCLSRCPSTPEYEPVCGTDGVTYDNYGQLICAFMCGVGGTVKSDGPCDEPTTIPTTTQLPLIVDCLQRCPPAKDFRPVCGTNNITYDNPRMLICAYKCGIDVSLKNQGPCPEPSDTSPTGDGNSGKIIPPRPEDKDCYARCPAPSIYEPVCATDGTTYDNRFYIICAAMCGEDVWWKHDGLCQDDGITTSQTPTTTESPMVTDCITRCPNTEDYRPVCGSNFVTYLNPRQLICAQKCGVDVTLLQIGPCPSSTSSTPTDELPGSSTRKDREAAPTTPDPTGKPGDCLSRCPSTSEYEPVCGTDGVTYDNYGQLICAFMCGVGGTLTSDGPCDEPTTIPTTTEPPEIVHCLQRCPPVKDFHPVCGTNNITYDNPRMLICAHKCGVDVSFRNQGPCPEPSSTSSPPTGTPPAPVIPPRPEDKDCYARCPAPSIYEPVCATDGTTYDNRFYIICAAMCGEDVWRKHDGFCQEEDTTTSQTPTTTESPVVKDCITRCPNTDDYRPVCGSNFVTYLNPRQLICAQKCGVDVTLLNIGPCPISSSTAPTPTNEPPPASSTRKDREPAPTTPDPTGKPGDCLSRCPSTSEYEPVCGTDGVTYDNYGQLICAFMCGVGGTLKSDGLCDEPTTSSTTTESPLIVDCLQRCPPVKDFRPICGTNNITYSHPRMLICARKCGVDVNFRNQGPCPELSSTSLPPTGTPPTPVIPPRPEDKDCYARCPALSIYEPVCGTDGTTYDNRFYLICAAMCGEDVTLLQTGPCPSSTSSTPTDELPGSSTRKDREPAPTTPDPTGKPGDCLSRCPSTPEYEPVCGTDGVTYDNYGQLICAFMCGVGGGPKSYGPCDEPTTIPTTTQSPDLVHCLQRCPPVKDFRPVCGTNNITYNHPRMLICAHKCGVDVSFRNQGPCPEPSSTSSPPTGTPPAPVLPPRPEDKDCYARCPAPSIYEPVCGTDGTTYDNRFYIICAAMCGEDVWRKHDGRCQDEDTTTSQTPTTTESPIVRDCITRCPNTDDYRPVCGSNFVTYLNPRQLICAQKCGVDVTLLQTGPCPSSTSSTPTDELPGSSTRKDREPAPTTPDPTGKPGDCLSRCPSTSEYEPVCGTDGVTYDNYGQLICAFMCGVGGTLKSDGPCDEPTTIPTTTEPPEIVYCLQRCPPAKDFRPVCGTNNITYDNPRMLICAQKCGVDVSFRNQGPCPEPSSTSSPPTGTPPAPVIPPRPEDKDCYARCPAPSIYEPVCGTDGTTYDNRFYIICAAMCGEDVWQKHDGICQDEDTTTSQTPTTTLSPIVKDCITRCPNTDDYRPVCGSNFVTYLNPRQLICAQKCGVDVTLLQTGPCPSSTSSTPTDELPGSSTRKDREPAPTTPDPTGKPGDCLSRCPSTSEYEPVCGTDGVTYDNYGQLICAFMCGVGGTLKLDGPCDEPTTIPTTTEPPEIVYCLQRCLPAKDFHPVCGTNNITYDNSRMLICAQKCGVDVSFRNQGPCPEPSSTSSPPTGTPPAPVIPPRPEDKDCYARCPAPSIYEPVCGTDGTTYDNRFYIICAAMCGEDVWRKHDGRCQDEDTTTSQTPTTTLSPIVKDCITRCPNTEDYRPVCGSNFVTYLNPRQLICAQKCGVDVTLLQTGPCPSSTSSTPTDELPGSSTRKDREPAPTTPDPTGKPGDCLSRCPSTPEYEPVCGTDGVTYDNYGQLICAFMCGVGGTLKSDGPCDEPTTIPTTTEPPEIVYCLQRCLPAKDFHPVCGTNNITYHNPRMLICAQKCGVDVSFRNQGPCPEPSSTSLPPTGTPPAPVIPPRPEDKDCYARCPAPSIYEPVCATDGTTYDNRFYIICAAMCGEDISMKHHGICQDEDTTTTSPPCETTKPMPTTTESDDVKQCIGWCVESKEYSPVCGTNGFTYDNPERLECAAICGVEVTEKHSGPCEDDTSAMSKMLRLVKEICFNIYNVMTGSSTSS